jgi:cytidylate kinase
VRAKRRWLELQDAGKDRSFEEVLQAVKERDARDAARATAPMKPAADAHLLDTSELDICAAFRAAREIIDAHLKKAATGKQG